VDPRVRGALAPPRFVWRRELVPIVFACVGLPLVCGAAVWWGRARHDAGRRQFAHDERVADATVVARNAIRDGEPAVLTAALARGAAIGRTEAGEALYDAVRRGRPDVAEVLVERDADLTLHGGAALPDAVDAGDVWLAMRLVERGADVAATGESREPALVVCAGRCELLDGDVSLPRLLLDRGANVTARGDEGATALHRVAGCSAPASVRLPLARLLIERGADVDAKDARGRTALMLAAEDEMRALLLAHGAKE
jgi:hypothetical protein